MTYQDNLSSHVTSSNIYKTGTREWERGNGKEGMGKGEWRMENGK